MYEGRIRLTVRYDGTAFAGSQIQPGKRTVAGTLTVGLESLLMQELHLLFAGRTDSGVHAEGNVCAFDARLQFPIEKLAGLVNLRLPDDLQIREACPTLPGFHPRFDAQARIYEYTIYRGADVPVDRMRYVAGYSGAWHGAAVEQALGAVAGRHAFHSFAEGSLKPQYAYCVLDRVQIREHGPEVVLRFRSNRFLRQMLRRLVGALLKVAGGQISPQRFINAIDGELDFQFKPAPPRGLVLFCVEYESRID
jgi:tRNA pseudouridine38-40 synthase